MKKTVHTLRKYRQYTILGVVAVVAIIGGISLMSIPSSAHEDPLACDSNGVGLSITVLRADGTTPVGGGSVQSGETINYRATLSHLNGSNCNFDGGTLSITTPDGVVHVLASPATPVVPLVTIGSPFVASLQPYVVSEDDVTSGNLHATATYTGGSSHTGEQHDNAGANVDRNTPYQDVALEVTKTATPASEITYRWTIDKSVSPAVWDLFTGDTGTSQYDVVVEKSESSTNHSVNGTITVHNPAAFADAVITSISDVLSIDGAVSVDCGSTVFPYNLGAGEDLVCTYSATVASDATQTNTATAETSGDVGGDSGDATVDFTGVVPTEINSTVNVDDTYLGDLGSFSGSGSVSYERTFACDGDEGTHGNTATIVETQQSSSASVTVNCHQLAVEKTATTDFDRRWTWTIEKSADQTDLLLAEGESFDVNYEVTVDETFQDVNAMVSGTITVTNPVGNPSATINSVADVLSDDAGPVVVDCGDAIFPYVLAGGDSLICTYSEDLAGTDAQTNTATATQQNFDYDTEGLGTASGTTAYSGSAAVNFGEPTNLTDDCITVSDTNPLGPQGIVVCYDDPVGEKTFSYAVTFGPDGGEGVDVPVVCGEHNHQNTASFVSDDTEATGSASWGVDVTVECFQGCTLTQGYWKTHSDQGPAPFDDNWDNLGDVDGDGVMEQESEMFYLSGMTWLEVFRTAPKGNAYYQLAHQYMAAYLNGLNGADTTPSVDTALSAAETFFETYTPASFSALGKKSPVRTNVITWAGVLGSYNEGLIGPGHCDEQVS